MNYHKDQNGTWAKKTLDSQIICFDPEIEKALEEEEWIFKVEPSNSGLRYILTMVGGKNCEWGVSPDDKGWYVRTLKMDLQESINAAKTFIGPSRPILVDREAIAFNKEPSPEWEAFERWFKRFESRKN